MSANFAGPKMRQEGHDIFFNKAGREFTWGDSSFDSEAQDFIPFCPVKYSKFIF